MIGYKKNYEEKLEGERSFLLSKGKIEKMVIISQENILVEIVNVIIKGDLKTWDTLFISALNTTVLVKLDNLEVWNGIIESHVCKVIHEKN